MDIYPNTLEFEINLVRFESPEKLTTRLEEKVMINYITAFDYFSGLAISVNPKNVFVKSAGGIRVISVKIVG